MAEAILDLRLDTVQPNRVRLVYGVQNDYNSRYICARFTASGTPIALEKAAAVRINAKRPDGKKDAFPGTVNADGTAKVPVAQWMLEVPGEVSASITAVTTNGALTTQEFYIMAKASLWDSTGEPDPENPDKDVIQTIIASENERVIAETERVANESARKSAETARADAETQRLANESARVKSEAERVSAESERKTGFAEMMQTFENLGGVEVSKEEPTNPNIDVWIDPDEEGGENFLTEADIAQGLGDRPDMVLSQKAAAREFENIATNQSKYAFWEVGLIGANGTVYTSQTALHTKDYFTSEDFPFAKVEKDGVLFAVAKYDTEKNFIERSTMNLTEYYFESGFYYKITFTEKVDGTDIEQTPNDYYKIGLYSYKNYKLESTVNRIISGNYDDGNIADFWESGSISIGGESFVDTRIIKTKDFFTAEDFISAHTTKENCFMAVARYTTDKVFIDRTVFVLTEYVFEEGFYYKILIREVFDGADIEQTPNDYYKVYLLAPKANIITRGEIGNINNISIWENGTIIVDGKEYSSTTIIRTKDFFTCEDFISAKIVKNGAAFAVARYSAEKVFIDRSTFSLTEYVFERGYFYKLVLLEKVDGTDIAQTVDDFYKIELHGNKIKYLMKTEVESKKQINSLSEKVNAIGRGGKRLWSVGYKKGKYEAWAFGNTWFDKSTGKHCLIYNAKSSHGSTDGNVYFTSKFDFDDFNPENQILVAEHTSSYGCRCHGSGIAANGDYIALVLHHDATGGGPLYVYRSSDKGATWTSAECLIDGVNLTSGESGSCFLTKSGTLLSFDRINGASGDYCKIIRSTNNGVSWSGTDINKGMAASPLEGSFVQLSNDDIYCIVRGVLFDSYTVIQKTYITKSTDDGVSWTTLAEMADFDATCNPVSVIYHEKSKRVEMIYGSRYVLPNGKNAIYRRICTETEFENGYYGEAVKIAESGTGADFGYIGVSKSDRNVINAYYYCDDEDGGVCICNMVLDFIF